MCSGNNSEKQCSLCLHVFINENKYFRRVSISIHARLMQKAAEVNKGCIPNDALYTMHSYIV